MDNRAIGVFDSGVGGLTVVRQILKILPGEKIIYIGDTARVPWGTRGEELIKKFSHQLANFLTRKKVKLIIVACHTASSIAFSFLKRKVELPLLGVVEPAVQKAIEVTRNGKIGVIGTPVTIKSGIWPRKIKQKGSHLSIFTLACPLLVPVVEAGFSGHRVAGILVQEYLAPLKKKRLDTLVLACTHYPLLKKTIKKVIGSRVALVDPGKETALFLREHLTKKNAFSSFKKPVHEFYFTDPSFETLKITQKFLGKKIDKIIKVEI